MRAIASARRILLCLRYGIGDVIMETPALDALRSAAPDARITALGAAPAVELLERDPRVDAVVDATRWGLTHRWDAGEPSVRHAIAEWCAAVAPDLVIDSPMAIDAVRRALQGRGVRSLAADAEAEAAAIRTGRDGVAAIRAAVRAGWGIDVPDDRLPRLHIPEDARRHAAALLAHLGPARNEPAPVALSPVASLPMKRWPAERFAAVADWVVDHVGRRVLLFVGPQHDEGRRVRRAVRRRDRVHLIGALHLQRTAALLERCAVLLCNDTGLMHMAAAVGTPTVALFGPTSPGIYLPPATHARGLVADRIDCPHRNTESLEPPGCWNSDHCLIAEHSCIWKVGADDATDALDRLLDAA